MARQFEDSKGTEWTVSEDFSYGLVDRGDPPTRTLLQFTSSSGRTIRLDVPRMHVNEATPEHLSGLLVYAVELDGMRETGQLYREVVDANGVLWLVSVEGLAGAERGQKGSVGLRFLSANETRYKVPGDLLWDSMSEEELLEALRHAVPTAS